MSHNYDRQHNDSDYASGRDDRDPYGPGGPSRRRHEDNFESNEPSYQSNTSREHGPRPIDNGEARENEGYGSSRHHKDEQEGYGHGGRHHVGSGETYVGLGGHGGDERRSTGDIYGGESATTEDSYQNQSSNEQYGSADGNIYQSEGQMHFPASEAKHEENPFIKPAQVLASDTQNILKGGIKEAEHWAAEKVKNVIHGGSKHHENTEYSGN